MIPCFHATTTLVVRETDSLECGGAMKSIHRTKNYNTQARCHLQMCNSKPLAVRNCGAPKALKASAIGARYNSHQNRFTSEKTAYFSFFGDGCRHAATVDTVTKCALHVALQRSIHTSAFSHAVLNKKSNFARMRASFGSLRSYRTYD